MPLSSFACSQCGQQAPTALRQHGKYAERMSWLRRHYSRKHPRLFAQWGK